jgi:hypothetical protein
VLNTPRWGKKRLAMIPCNRVPLSHSVKGKDYMPSSYSVETSASARSR